MDSQKPNDSRPVPTEADIARAEAEAVAAMLRGEPPRTRVDNADDAPEPPAAPDFVPYVDDAPAPQAAQDEDDEGEYIPGELEKRVNALSDRQWRNWQIAGGAALGLAAITILFLGSSSELSTYTLILSAGLALLLPRYLERIIRRKLTLARSAMLIAMVAGLVVMGVILALRGGFSSAPQ